MWLVLILEGWCVCGLVGVGQCRGYLYFCWGLFESIGGRWRSLISSIGVYGQGERGGYKCLFKIRSGIFWEVLSSLG